MGGLGVPRLGMRSESQIERNPSFFEREGVELRCERVTPAVRCRLVVPPTGIRDPASAILDPPIEIRGPGIRRPSSATPLSAAGHIRQPGFRERPSADS